MKMLDMLRAMDAFVDNDNGRAAELALDTHEPVCAIAGCDEWPVITCECCNRGVCADDILGAALDDLGICSDCAFKCAGGMTCQVVSHE